MATDTSLASFNQGLPTPTSNVSNFLLAMRPLYEQYQTLQANQLNKLLNSSSPASNVAYPDLSSLLDRVNAAYDQYAGQASDYATSRFNNAAKLASDAFEKKAVQRGLNAQGTAGMTGPESEWRQSYAKNSAENMGNQYANIASQAALGKAGFASSNALTGLMNQIYQQNLSNQYNNNLWKMQLANQYSNNSNPFVNLASIGASLYRGNNGDTMGSMSGFGTGSGTNVDMGSNGSTVADYGFPSNNKRESTYSYFPASSPYSYFPASKIHEQQHMA